MAKPIEGTRPFTYEEFLKLEEYLQRDPTPEETKHNRKME